MNSKSLLFAVITITLFLSACADKEGRDSPSGQEITEVVRETLQAGASAVAPGQTLELSRVVIPAGKDVAPHTHPGPQLALITGGTLTYTVLRGEVQVTRMAGSKEALTETIGPGQTVELLAGDSIAEFPGMVHTARNSGESPVTIHLSTLFPTGEPASSPAN